MTVNVTISVNGNYKLPYTYKQGTHSEAGTISGRGLDRPNVMTIPFAHGADAMTLTVGPESQDNGESA